WGAVPRPLFIAAGAAFQVLLREQLTYHKRKNPAVPVVIDFNRRIDSQFHWHVTLFSFVVLDLDGKPLSWLNLVRQTADRKFLRAVEPKRLCGHTVEKLQRQDAHADQI